MTPTAMASTSNGAGLATAHLFSETQKLHTINQSTANTWNSFTIEQIDAQYHKTLTKVIALSSEVTVPAFHMPLIQSYTETAITILALKQAKLEAMRAISAKDTTIHVQGSQIRKLQETINKLTAENTELESEKVKRRAQIERQEKEKANLKEKIERMTGELAELRDRLKENKVKIHNLTQKLKEPLSSTKGSHSKSKGTNSRIARKAGIIPPSSSSVSTPRVSNLTVSTAPMMGAGLAYMPIGVSYSGFPNIGYVVPAASYGPFTSSFPVPSPVASAVNSLSSTSAAQISGAPDTSKSE